jgi:SAM-dependent methyltransferase
MLARRALTSAFIEWNEKWHAPFGPEGSEDLPLDWKLDSRRARRLGPFAFQLNNTTRKIEYAWAFHVAEIQGGTTVLEIGGALSGFQFVLGRHGATVTNVDPFTDYGAATPHPESPEDVHARLNRYFSTKVRLKRSTLADAGFEDECFDRAYCISTVEHLPRDEISRTLKAAYRVLRKGALFVLTVDLFLDLVPFTQTERNHWGTNISIRWVVEESGMTLVDGERGELFGFPAFDAQEVLANVNDYLVGEYSATLVQMFVLQK